MGERGPEVRDVSSERNINTGMTNMERLRRQETEFASDTREQAELARMRAPRARGSAPRFRPTGERAARALLAREED